MRRVRVVAPFDLHLLPRWPKHMNMRDMDFRRFDKHVRERSRRRHHLPLSAMVWANAAPVRVFAQKRALGFG